MSATRRSFFRKGGALVVSFAFERILLNTGLDIGRLNAQGPATAPSNLDDYLAIHADGTATIFTSHVDPGTGISVVYRQIAAEELGIPVERFSLIQGDTTETPNHGGTGGSSGVPRGGSDIRRVAATARQALLSMASTKLDRPTSELTLEGGEVRPIPGGKGVAIAALIGNKRFNLKVDPKAPLKSPATYTVVGKPILRTDLPGKATGHHVYVHDFSLPGMLHARVIRPPSFGTRLLSVDKASVRAIPGVRIIRIESFLGVVATDEWAAIRAARELKVTWSEGQTLPSSATLEQDMRQATPEREQSVLSRGDTTAGLAGAAKQLSAIYFWPFQSHASLAPSCVVADVKDSGIHVWSSTQDAFGLRNIVAKVLGTPADKIRVTYLDGSGSYGSNGAYDAAADAVLLSRAAGQPVRLQWMRHDEHALDPKGPAQFLEVRGGLDTTGNIVAWETRASAFGAPQWADAQLGPIAAGLPSGLPRPLAPPTTQNLDPPYDIPNLRVDARLLKTLPIRTSNLRAPSKIGNTFASEGFTDELAVAAGMDAVAFRRRGLTDPRALAVIDRAAAMIGWQPRPSPNPSRGTGRGFAYARYKQAENYVAMAMEVEVDKAGKIKVKRIVCAHDCGLIVNPDGLRNQVEGNILHTLSRSLHEEVIFDADHITSVNWASYPILRFPEVPAVEITLLDHPDQPAWGAGEAACAPVAAALANAVFDATGVRLRNAPMRGTLTA
jgi:nicotinate dehydrogenase subunit B